MATKPYNELGRYGVVGIDLVLAILICGAVGHWLDGRYFGSHDYGLIVGGLLGAAVGVRNLVRAASRMQKDIEAAEAKDPEGSRWTVDESWVHKDEPGGDGAKAKPPEPPPDPPAKPDERPS
jgi:hypothetical protein